MSDTKIRKFVITDTCGLEQVEIRPGAITVISGANGVGKSSVLAAIRGIFEGGFQPTIIRQGAKKSVVEMTLTNGITVTKTTTEKGATLKVVSAEGAELPKPQQFVDNLAAGFAFDPIGFCTADKKERAAFLLAAMPISFAPEEIREAIDEQFPDALDLTQLGQLSKRLTEERQALNRQARDAEGTIRDLNKSLPEEPATPATDWKAELGSLRLKLSESTAEKTKVLGSIAEDLQNDLAEIDRQAEEARKEARQRCDLAVKAEHERFEPKIIHLEKAISVAQERAGAEEKTAGLRSTIGIMQAKYREKSIEAETITGKLQRLEALRKKRLAALPIPGVEIRDDGGISVDGLDFDTQLNRARQFCLAFQLAALKGTALMIADDAEHLQGDVWQDFLAAAEQFAKESGVQIITARATSDAGMQVIAIA